MHAEARTAIQRGDELVLGSWANTLAIGRSEAVINSVRQERAVMFIEQRRADVGVDLDHLEAEDPLDEELIANRQERLVELHAEWVAQCEVSGLAYAALNARETSYITLFAPSWESLEAHRLRLNAEHAAEAAERQAHNQLQAANRVAAQRAYQLQFNAARQDRLIEAVGLRRNRLVLEGTWAAKREMCWIELNGGVCETHSPTRRMCSVEGCDKKVCRRCITCGDH